MSISVASSVSEADEFTGIASVPVIERSFIVLSSFMLYLTSGLLLLIALVVWVSPIISESVKLLEEIGSDSLKLLVDSFHTNLEEDPGFIWDELKEIAHLVAHLHLADCTRRAPGTGHYDFKQFLGFFKDANFGGFASIEAISKPSFERLAEQSSEYLRSIL